VAFTIEEDFHRQGMARVLLQHKAAIARESGVSRFEAADIGKSRWIASLPAIFMIDHERGSLYSVPVFHIINLTVRSQRGAT
jgi:hypothetical protein